MKPVPMPLMAAFDKMIGEKWLEWFVTMVSLTFVKKKIDTAWVTQNEKEHVKGI